MKPEGSVCRPARSIECDTQETCTGISAECPEDIRVNTYSAEFTAVVLLTNFSRRQMANLADPQMIASFVRGNTYSLLVFVDFFSS
jgi:hypothetical protein